MSVTAVAATAGEAFSGQVHVRRRRWATDDFAILDCTWDGARVTLVGPIAHLEDDERVDVTGRWERHAEYGLQVRVQSAIPLPPTGREAVVDYLRRVRHIGV